MTHGPEAGEPPPRLYAEFAAWWPLLSAPEDYAEEAAFYLRVLREHADPVRTLLELGSGGGNTASHLRHHTVLTLVEPSAGMREVSRKLNPGCDHVAGDMRDVRLGRTFDAVFVHDAISYMTTAADLQRALATAFAHCRPGGAALFAPDHLRDTFTPSTITADTTASTGACATSLTVYRATAYCCRPLQRSIWSARSHGYHTSTSTILPEVSVLASSSGCTKPVTDGRLSDARRATTASRSAGSTLVP